MTATAPLWPTIRVAYPWGQRAAHLLKNEDQRAGAPVQRRLCGLLGAMARHRAAAGELAPALAHCLKVTRSYWPGLFHCYEGPDLPRTNNDLEQFFGAYRSHERRTSGRKGAAPALVLRGPVRIVAAAPTRLCPFAAGERAPADLSTWQALRRDLRTRQQRRTLQRRFRHDPSSSLAPLEADFLKLTLPP